MKRLSILLIIFLLVHLLVIHAQLPENLSPITLDNATSVTELMTLEGHKGAVNSVTFSPDSSLLAYGGDDNVARIWTLGTDSEPILFEGNVSPINTLTFSPDGTMLASGSDTTQFPLMVWNVSSGEVLGKVELTGIGSALFPYLLGRPAKIFSVVFISLDNSVLAAGEVMANFVWYKDAGGTASASNNYSSGDPTIFSIAFDPEGDFEAIGRSDGLVLNPIDDEGVIQADATMTLSCHSDAVSSVAFNFDGSVLASGSWDDTVCLWNMATDIPEQIGVLTGHTNDVTGVAFSLDGSLMASSSLDGTLRLWDVETQEELAVLSAPESTEFRSVAFSPDGTMIATAGSDGMVRLWGGPEL